MPDAFISYSRKNIAFARLLLDAFEKNDIHAWIDWQDIPPSAVWLSEVYEAIEHSDTFIYIISENSVASEICGQEIEHAIKNHKRLIPIVVNEVEPSQVPEPLAELNWIFFTQEDEFSNSVSDLISAIQTDQDYLKEHTRLQNRALDWQKKDLKRSELLQGQDLMYAERWLSEASGKEPPQTALQTDYIFASRKAADRQQQIRKIVILTAIFIAMILSAWAITQSVKAVRTTHARATAESIAIAESVIRATAQADAVNEEHYRATAQADLQSQIEVVNLRTLLSNIQSLLLDIGQSPNENIDLGLLLSVEMVRMSDSIESRNTLLHVLTMHPYLERFLYNGSGIEFMNFIFDPNGKLLLNSYFNQQILIFDLISGTLVDTLVPPKKIANASHPENRNITLMGMQYNQEGTRGISYSPGIKDWILWDTISYTPIGDPFSELIDPESVLSISPDLTYLATIEKEFVGIRERETGILWAIFPQPVTGLTYEPVFSEDESLILLATDDRTVEIFEVETGELQQVLDLDPDLEAGENNSAGLVVLEINVQGSSLVVKDFEEALVFDLSTGKISDQYRENSENLKDAWDFIPFNGPGGKPYIASSRLIYNEDIKVFDEYYHYVKVLGENDLVLSRFSSLSNWHYPTIEAMYAATHEFFEIHHETLLVASHRSNQGNFEIVLFNPNQIYPILDSFGFEGGDLTGLQDSLTVFHPIERDILALSQCEEGQEGMDCDLTVWRLADEESNLLKLLDLVNPVVALNFDQRGEKLFFTDREGTLYAWDWQTGMPGSVATGLNVQSDLLAISDDGRFLAVGSGGNGESVVVLDVKNDIDQSQIKVRSVKAMTFQPGTTTLVFSEGDSVAFWDVERNVLVNRLLDAQTGVYDRIAFHPNGAILATAGEEGLAIWDLQTLTLIAYSEIPAFASGNLHFLAYDPTGTWLVSEVGNSVNLYDPQTGKLAGQLAPTDMGDLQHVVTYEVLPSPTFSADGSRLAAYTLDGQLYFWQLDLDAWIEASCKVANRNLTPSEWSTYLGLRPYQETCK